MVSRMKEFRVSTVWFCSLILKILIKHITETDIFEREINRDICDFVNG